MTLYAYKHSASQTESIISNTKTTVESEYQVIKNVFKVEELSLQWVVHYTSYPDDDQETEALNEGFPKSVYTIIVRGY